MKKNCEPTDLLFLNALVTGATESIVCDSWLASHQHTVTITWHKWCRSSGFSYKWQETNQETKFLTLRYSTVYWELAHLWNNIQLVSNGFALWGNRLIDIGMPKDVHLAWEPFLQIKKRKNKCASIQRNTKYH